jgi:hypothetical protein
MSTGSIRGISGVSGLLLTASLTVGSGASSSGTGSSASSSGSGDTTNVVTYPDGSTVTTVRNAQGQIVSILVTPPVENVSTQNSTASNASTGTAASNNGASSSGGIDFYT